MTNRKFNLGGDNHIQIWYPFNHNGNTYQLNHLDADIIEYEIQNQCFRFYVTFSHHCFTKTLSGENDRDELLYHSPKDKRHFHFRRYELSFNLPGIIKDLPTAITYHGRHGSYAVCEFLSEEGETIYYQVAFNVFRVAKKYRLHVTTAYPLETRPKIKKVGFHKVVMALSQGKKLPLPHK